MVADDFVDDEAEELLAELGVEVGACRQRPQPRDLGLLTPRVGGRERVVGLVKPHGLGDAEALRQHVDDRGVDVVDAAAVARQHRIAVAACLCEVSVRHRGAR